MKSQRNLVGNKYGKLLVLESLGQINPGNPHYFSLVRCDCGHEFKVYDTLLVSNQRKQCPVCSRNDKKTHGMTGTRIHTIWVSMRQRCNNKNSQDYYLYGERGISVCPEWNKSFEAFYEWAMRSGYTDELSIDRIDVNGNYEPDNCRFITMAEQASNKRRNVYIIYENERVTVSEAARRSGISQGVLQYRLSNGWSAYDATHIPVGGEYSTNRSKGHEIKHSVILKNTISGNVFNFDSLSEASRFMGKNVGYLSNIMNKRKTEKFKVGDYLVKVQKHNN